MTYLWLEGLPIDVETDHTGQPLTLVWNGKKHAVERVFNRWIFHDRWWSEEEHLWRDYYYLITETRLILVIFQNRVSGSWFIYRLFD